jgi:hypothetical protein
MKETRNSYKILVRKSLGRSKSRLEDDIRVYFRGTGFEDMNWLEVTHDHVQWWALVLVVLCCKRVGSLVVFCYCVRGGYRSWHMSKNINSN